MRSNTHLTTPCCVTHCNHAVLLLKFFWLVKKLPPICSDNNMKHIVLPLSGYKTRVNKRKSLSLDVPINYWMNDSNLVRPTALLNPNKSETCRWKQLFRKMSQQEWRNSSLRATCWVYDHTNTHRCTRTENGSPGYKFILLFPGNSSSSCYLRIDDQKVEWMDENGWSLLTVSAEALLLFG